MKKSFIFIIMSILLLASCNFITDDGTRSYTIYHYLENIEDDEYTLNSQLTQKFKGKLNDETVVEALSLEGFIPQDFEQIILGEKDNFISIYYKRIVSTVTFIGNGGTHTKTNNKGLEESVNQVVITGKYGTLIEEPVFTRNSFIWKGWNKELPEFIPASDLELTGLWTAEFANTTNKYIIHPVQKFVDMSNIEITRKLCWDYRGGINPGNQLIIWPQKGNKLDNVQNQVFCFEPVPDKDNTYYIFTNYSQNNYYLSENTKSYTIRNSGSYKQSSVSINGLCAGNNKSPASLQFELIPVVSADKPNDELFAFRISGTERYVTTGYSLYNYFTKPVYMTGSGEYEPMLIFDSLRLDENGNVDDTQLFYLDNIVD